MATAVNTSQKETSSTPENVLRELSGSEAMTHALGQEGFAQVAYTFHLKFHSQDAKQQLPHKLQLCLKILMKRHPLLRACVRQQPQSQPPRLFFCELQPTADGDVTPELTTDLSSDWQQVMTSLVAQTFKHDEERPLWSVVYMPNVTSPFPREGSAKLEATIIFRFCHVIVDGQGNCLPFH